MHVHSNRTMEMNLQKCMPILTYNLVLCRDTDLWLIYIGNFVLFYLRKKSNFTASEYADVREALATHAGTTVCGQMCSYILFSAEGFRSIALSLVTRTVRAMEDNKNTLYYCFNKSGGPHIKLLRPYLLTCSSKTLNKINYDRQ